jgi:ADP-ribose pyrophosphatase
MKISAISQFSHDDIELKPIERVYDGFFKINVYRFHHALFAGGKSVEIKREIL